MNRNQEEKNSIVEEDNRHNLETKLIKKSILVKRGARICMCPHMSTVHREYTSQNIAAMMCD